MSVLPLNDLRWGTRLAGLVHLEGDELEAALLEAGDDLADEAGREPGRRPCQ